MPPESSDFTAEKVILEGLKELGVTLDIQTLAILATQGKHRINFRGGAAKKILELYHYILTEHVRMAMSQSERLRLIQEQSIKYVSRNKCVDSSLLTIINQAKASSVPTPGRVALPSTRDGCSGKGTATGKGANGEYIGILQAAQAAAFNAPCSTNKPTDTGVLPVITLPVPCINFNAVPFTQQNLSTMYVAPCTDPGKRDYFRPYVSNGPGCTTNKITTPSG